MQPVQTCRPPHLASHTHPLSSTLCLPSQQEAYLRRTQSVLGSRASAGGHARIAVHFAVAGLLEELRQVGVPGGLPSSTTCSRAECGVVCLAPLCGGGRWLEELRQGCGLLAAPAVRPRPHLRSCCAQLPALPAAPPSRATTPPSALPSCHSCPRQVEEFSEKPIEEMPVHVSDIFAS